VNTVRCMGRAELARCVKGGRGWWWWGKRCAQGPVGCFNRVGGGGYVTNLGSQYSSQWAFHYRCCCTAVLLYCLQLCTLADSALLIRSCCLPLFPQDVEDVVSHVGFFLLFDGIVFCVRAAAPAAV
jgi:hypothetical protein